MLEIVNHNWQLIVILSFIQLNYISSIQFVLLIQDKCKKMHINFVSCQLEFSALFIHDSCILILKWNVLSYVEKVRES